MRIRHIMDGSQVSASRVHRRIAWFAAGLLVLPLAAVQVAVAKSDFNFLSPLSSGVLTSSYGERHNPFTGELMYHNGIDIKAPLGTPVLAPAPGEVIFAGMKNELYGIVVELRHRGDVRSLYAHLHSTDLNVGDTITEGTPIGLVGVTGQSTGPHVHVELYKDGERVDPQVYMPLTADAESHGEE